MRALTVGDRVVELTTVADPTPEPGEVVVETHSCGICGSDVHAVESGRAARGQVLGHELAGTVVALGNEVSSFKTGDLVAVSPLGGCGTCEECRRGLTFRCKAVANLGINAPGAFAEYLAVPAGQLYALPEGMELENGAHVEPLAVALHAVHLAGAGAGTRAIVFGVGTIGLSVVMALRAAGASEIVVIGRSEGRRLAAARMGADLVVDSSSVDLRSYFEEESEGFDAAFECSGAEEAFGLLLGSLASDGKLVELALSSHAVPIPLAELVGRNVHLIGSCAFSPEEFAESLELIASGTVDPTPLVSRRVSLAEAPQTFLDLRHPKDLVGALVQPWR